MTIAASIPTPLASTAHLFHASAIVLFDSDKVSLHLFDTKQGAPLIRGVRSESCSPQSIVRDVAGDRLVEDILAEYRAVSHRFGAEDLMILATERFSAMEDAPKAIERIRRTADVSVKILSKELKHRLWAEGIRMLEHVQNFALLEIGPKETILTVVREHERLQTVSFPIGSLTSYLDHVANVVPDHAEMRSMLEMMSYELSKHDLPDVAGLPIYGIEDGAKDPLFQLRIQGDIPSGQSEFTRYQIKQLLKPTDTGRRLTQLQLLQKLPKRVHLFYPETAILYTVLSLLDANLLRVMETGMLEGYLVSLKYGFDL